MSLMSVAYSAIVVNVVYLKNYVRKIAFENGSFQASMDKRLNYFRWTNGPCINA